MPLPTKPFAPAALIAAGLMFTGIFATAASAQSLPAYPTPGTPNLVPNVLIAQTTGHLFGYFAGEDAGFESTLGLLVNGTEVDSGVFPSKDPNLKVGDPHDFGSVNAGDVLTFFITNISGTFYSDAIRSPDKVNHAYSASFAGDGTLPAGTYVGFEDIANGDFDYNDLNFVFNQANGGGGTVPITPTVPLPSSAPMFGAALVALGIMGFRLKQRAKKTA